MLVLTFQKKELLMGIKNKTYKPDFSKSEFAYSSIRFTKAYYRMLKEIQKKNKDFRSDDGFLWAWAKNPDPNMVRNYINKGYVALYLDVDESKCVLSDYYDYTDYVFEESNEDSFIIKQSDFNSKNVSNNSCIQCVLPLSAINNIRGIFLCNSMTLFSSIDDCYYASEVFSGINECNKIKGSRVKHHSSFLTRVNFILGQVWKEDRIAMYS